MHPMSSHRLTQGPKSQATSPRSSSGNLQLSWNFFHPTFIPLGTDLLSRVPPAHSLIVRGGKQVMATLTAVMPDLTCSPGFIS